MEGVIMQYWEKEVQRTLEGVDEHKISELFSIIYAIRSKAYLEGYKDATEDKKQGGYKQC